MQTKTTNIFEGPTKILGMEVFWRWVAKEVQKCVYAQAECRLCTW